MSPNILQLKQLDQHIYKIMTKIIVRDLLLLENITTEPQAFQDFRELNGPCTQQFHATTMLK